MTDLEKYLETIKEKIEIDFPTANGLSPWIKKQKFRNNLYIGFSNADKFYVSTVGKIINEIDARKYAVELLQAAKIVETLNQLYIKLW